MLACRTLVTWLEPSRLDLRSWFHGRSDYSIFDVPWPSKCYHRRFETDVLNVGPRKVYPNISKEERDAINSLKHNSNLIINEADKGAAIVIMDVEDYLSECHRQLNDATYYKPLPKDPTAVFARKVTAAVKDARSAGIIDDDMQSVLTPNQPRPGRFYVLPKIHKRYDSFPHLKPYVKTLPSYVEDDNDFLRKLVQINEQHGPLPDDAILCTMDVTALYTNIPTNEFIAACQHYLSQQHSTTEVEVLSRFMELTLTQNNFELAGKHYIQVLGTAIGTRMAPSGACLFMGRLEEKFLSVATKKPLIWLRYIDDVFLIWTHGEEELDNFIAHCNTRHPTIKFTAERSCNSISFLDVMVGLQNGFLETDLYSKPTDTHQCLLWSSCHPKHTKQSLPYSLAFRLRRICSSDDVLATRVDKLKQHLLDRGYPGKVIHWNPVKLVRARVMNAYHSS
ncbi:uncharacterized protein [Amphiura filiformis]|uniref:uncharacterized protein n=1 Tax=Amphiura filiformis TaxID=82378 RepID=UPI003B22377C